MRTRVRKKYSYLVESHQKLLENNNFLNSQNYVLGNYLESKVDFKYKKKFFNTKKYESILEISLFLFFLSSFISAYFNNGIYVLIGFFIFFIFSFILPIFYLILISLFKYFKYKVVQKEFIGKKYIYRKKIRNTIKKNDYIIFKK